jgi:hypothetical protein
MGFCSLRTSPWARAFYDQKRTAGKGHQAALRALANRWLEVLWHCLQKGVLNEEAVHAVNRGRALQTARAGRLSSRWLTEGVSHLAEPELLGRAAWMLRLGSERQNLRSAVIWALENDAAETRLALASEYGSLCMASGPVAEASSFLVAALDDDATATRPPVRGRSGGSARLRGAGGRELVSPLPRGESGDCAGSTDGR